MIAFTVTDEGRPLINTAVAGTSPLIITGVSFYNGSTKIKTIKSTLKGCSYNDGNGIGEYVRIFVEDLSTDTYSVTHIGLLHNTTLVAKSSSLFFSKNVKPFLIELSCVFSGASKCSFTNIIISLPYATNFREGILRLAQEDETQKQFSVYNASTVDSKIEDLKYLLSDGVVEWKKINSSYITGTLQLDHIELCNDIHSVTSTAYLYIDGKDDNITRINVDGHLVGEVVSSQPSFTNIGIRGSNKLVNEEYILNLYSNIISSSNKQKLVSSKAVQDYVTTAISEIDLTPYLTRIDAQNTYQLKGDYVLASSLGGAAYKGVDTSIGGSPTDNNVPTSLAVKSFVEGKGYALSSDIPTQVSDLNNDAGYITSSSLPTVNNATLTIQKNSSTINTFTANASSDVTVNISVPTQVSDLTNDSGFLTSSDVSGAAYKGVDTSISSSSTDNNLPTSLAVYSYIDAQGFLTSHQSLAGCVASGEYDSANHNIYLKNSSGTVLSTIDATAFIKDGMVDTVTISNNNLVITFNTDAGKEDITIPLSSIFDPTNYYTKTQVDSGFVTTNTAQNLTGTKTWANSSTASTITTTNNLIITGGSTPSVVVEQVTHDSDTDSDVFTHRLTINKGSLEIEDSSATSGDTYEGTYNVSGITLSKTNTTTGDIYDVSLNGNGLEIEDGIDSNKYTKLSLANGLQIRGGTNSTLWVVHKTDM